MNFSFAFDSDSAAPPPPAFQPNVSQDRFEKLYRTSLRVLGICLGVSLLVHLATFYFFTSATNFNKATEAEGTPMEVSLVDSNFKDVVDTLQETAKEPPKDSKFVSTRNLRANEDVSPESAPTPLPQQGGAKAKTQEKQKAPAKPKTKTVFSLNQKDIAAEMQKEQDTLSESSAGNISPGFYEHLKRGQDFKVSATESDYGQYIYRMKAKLIDRWSPQRQIKAAWYSFNEIRVDLALVLDRAGEIVDLKVTQNSRFGEYDQEAIRAMRDSGPFPNPPKSLIQDDGYIYIPWSFGLYLRGMGMASRGVE